MTYNWTLYGFREVPLKINSKSSCDNKSRKLKKNLIKLKLIIGLNLSHYSSNYSVLNFQIFVRLR